jgi:ribosomal protein L1
MASSSSTESAEILWEVNSAAIHHKEDFHEMGKKYSDSLTWSTASCIRPEEAVSLVKQTAKAKFDETVELTCAWR